MLFSSIFVEYKSYDTSNNYIINILNKTNINYLKEMSFIVVDNSLDNDNYDRLSGYFYLDYDEEKYNDLNIRKINLNYKNYLIPIIYVKNNSNSGYGSGNNLGAKIADKYFKPLYYIFSNNDMICEDHEIDYDLVINLFLKNTDIGIIGVNIKNLDGSHQNPYKFLSINTRWILPELLFPFCRKKYSGNDLIINSKSDYVYRVRGSFMFVKAQAFNVCGGFDEKIFLYCEEPILSERLKMYGYRNFYLDEIHMIHNHIMDGKKMTSSYMKKLQLRFKSEMYYYKNYININNFAIIMARILFPIYVFKKKLFYLFKNIKNKSGGNL